MRKHNLLDSLTVADVWHLTVESPLTTVPETPLITTLQKFVEEARQRHVYVVDEARRLIGVIGMTTMVEQLFPFEAMLEEITEETRLFPHVRIGAKTVQEVMDDKPHFVKKDTKLGKMARILIREKLNELPVVDDDMKLIGQVNMYEVISAYLKAGIEDGNPL